MDWLKSKYKDDDDDDDDDDEDYGIGALSSQASRALDSIGRTAGLYSASPYYQGPTDVRLITTTPLLSDRHLRQEANINNNQDDSEEEQREKGDDRSICSSSEEDAISADDSEAEEVLSELRSIHSYRRLSLDEMAALHDEQFEAAERITQSLRELNTDDPEMNYKFLRRSLNISDHPIGRPLLLGLEERTEEEEEEEEMEMVFPPTALQQKRQQQEEEEKRKVEEGLSIVRIGAMICLAILVIVTILGVFALGEVAVGPPRNPVGPYKLVECQEGDSFFDFYDFYAGPDSAGSNGYLTYVSRERAQELGIVNVTEEVGLDDVFFNGSLQNNENPASSTDSRSIVSEPGAAATGGGGGGDEGGGGGGGEEEVGNEPLEEEKTASFVYMASAPTEAGPRESIRLEGKRRFNRGLFIIDLRHMPAGCGTWPAFWMTDEANWPINGEIDIVEGVNFQSVAKTALHSTKVCKMDDVPVGVKSGTWDTAVGIPDKKTGIPDMTFRYATNCFVYDPHQWLNQGCVAVDLEGGTLGQPLNDKGGGVYALEWDPINRHIRTWVFSPHTKVPPNLRDAIMTAGNADDANKVMPDPDLWDLPYGYFSIGDETNCPASHFRNMRLVFNLAFCGSVAGNRYFIDCTKEFKKFKSCNEWIKSNPEELKEAYWKVRGVYVYEREWENQWV